jgi:hypothetical protein
MAAVKEAFPMLIWAGVNITGRLMGCKLAGLCVAFVAGRSPKRAKYLLFIGKFGLPVAPKWAQRAE